MATHNVRLITPGGSTIYPATYLHDVQMTSANGITVTSNSAGSATQDSIYVPIASAGGSKGLAKLNGACFTTSNGFTAVKHGTVGTKGLVRIATTAEASNGLASDCVVRKTDMETIVSSAMATGGGVAAIPISALTIGATTVIQPAQAYSATISSGKSVVLSGGYQANKIGRAAYLLLNVLSGGVVKTTGSTFLYDNVAVGSGVYVMKFINAGAYVYSKSHDRSGEPYVTTHDL